MKAATKKICKHALVLTVETLAIGAAVAVLVFGAFFWRLSQGPMDVQFMVPYVEQTLASLSEGGGVRFEAGSAQLKGSTLDKPVTIEVKDVQLFVENNVPVAAFPKIEMSVTWRSLLLGPLMPEGVTFFNPALHVVRNADGSFAFNLGRDIESVKGTEQADTNFIKSLIGALHGGKRNIFRGITHVQVSGAAAIYEDLDLGLFLKLPKVDFIISRDKLGLMGHLALSLQMEDKLTELNGRLVYNREKDVASLLLDFRDIDPLLLSRQAKIFEKVSAITAPLSGRASLVFEEARRLVAASFEVSTGAGRITLKPLYEAPLDIKGASFDMLYDRRQSLIHLKDVAIDTGAGKISGDVSLSRLENDIVTTANAVLTNFDFNRLDQYWPNTLAVPARTWVVRHLSGAKVSKATLDLKGHMPVENVSAFELDSLSGRIDFTNMDVDYFPPLEPVKNTAGFALYDQHKFDIETTGGKLADMDVISSKIHISGFDQHDQHIDIKVALAGPLSTALRILDSKPLEYPKSLGLNSGDVRGMAKVDVGFSFPLQHSLELSQVDIQAKAELNDVRIGGLFAGLEVAGGPLSLEVTNKTMGVTGKASLSGQPTDLEWTKNFALDTPFSNQIKARILFDQAMQDKLGVDISQWVNGAVPADVLYRQQHDKTATLVVKADLMPAEITIDQLSYVKEANVPGQIDFLMKLDRNNKPAGVEGLKIVCPSLDVQGKVTFQPDAAGKTSLKSADLSPFNIGETSVAVKAWPRKDGYGFDLEVKGSVLDAHAFLETKDKKDSATPPAAEVSGGETPSAPAEPVPQTPFSLRLDVDKILAAKGAFLEKARVFLNRNEKGIITQLEVDARVGKGDLYVRFQPKSDQPQAFGLRIDADDAGAALSALGVTHKVKGGSLIAVGAPAPQGGLDDVTGRIWLSNFTVVDAPVLARLLNAISLSGFQELLSGEGIRFEKLRTKFTWIDRRPAPGKKKERLLGFKDGNTSGSALGLTFDGTVNLATDILDLRGTIVPVSPVNKAISSLPLIGDILSGGSEAVFAATYTVSGPVSDPKTSVNPLSVLAPGFLRKLFFQESESPEEAPPDRTRR